MTGVEAGDGDAPLVVAAVAAAAEGPVGVVGIVTSPAGVEAAGAEVGAGVDATRSVVPAAAM